MGSLILCILNQDQCSTMCCVQVDVYINIYESQINRATEDEISLQVFVLLFIEFSISNYIFLFMILHVLIM